MTRIYLLVVIWSAVIALTGIQPAMKSIAIPLLVAALLPQLVYWIIYLLMWRSFHKVRGYSSWTFSQIQVFIFALTQGFYKFIATGDILTPTKATIDQKSGEIPETP